MPLRLVLTAFALRVMWLFQALPQSPTEVGPPLRNGMGLSTEEHVGISFCQDDWAEDQGGQSLSAICLRRRKGYFVYWLIYSE